MPRAGGHRRVHARALADRLDDEPSPEPLVDDRDRRPAQGRVILDSTLQRIDRVGMASGRTGPITRCRLKEPDAVTRDSNLRSTHLASSFVPHEQKDHPPITHKGGPMNLGCWGRVRTGKTIWVAR